MKKREYGTWYNVRREQETDCIEMVGDSTWGTSQCSRRRGFGKDKLYCKQHGKQKYHRME